MSETTITIDLSAISDDQFDPSRPLRVAAMRGGQIIDQKTVTPAKEKNPRKIPVALSLGSPTDGGSGADIVVAPADDERNLQSKLTARKFVGGVGERIEGGTLQVRPSIYAYWRLCWFPRTYRIAGRLVHHEGSCSHPIAGARVEVLDVDYCWWWYHQDLITSGLTDANGFFDIHFTWCVPLWCLFEIIRKPPVAIDPDLRDRILAAIKQRPPIVKFPPPPPPPDPWEWERQLVEMGIDVPTAALPARGLSGVLQERVQSASAPREVRASALSSTRAAATASVHEVSRISAIDLLGHIIHWPPCDDPCDWRPDVRLRVTQLQTSGEVVIYQDAYSQIHWNLAGDLLDLTLEANASALYSNGCSPDPLLGNCMLLDAVGNTRIMPDVGDPVGGMYQPNYSAADSYGVEPDRRQRLGYVKNADRPWAGDLSVYGRFGIAAGVDYYQVQAAKWTNADLLAWDADHTHVPADAAFAAVPAAALQSFTRSYVEESPLPLHWKGEPFAPQTVGGISGLYKSRERFEQEYEAAHGGSSPAPSFGGWYWDYFTETRLFGVDASQMANGLYTFRFVCYRQTGVDGMGNPILTLVNMGLPGGVAKRCDTNPAKPELVTLYLHDTVHRADCDILTFKKNGATVIDECAMVTLTAGDWVEIEYQAFDAAGNLDSYSVTLQKGFSPEHDVLTLAGVTAVSGSSPEGPAYTAALADVSTPAIPPYWYGGTWKKQVPYSAFVAMGGSCAYNLRLRAWDRHTNGFSAGPGWGETGCEHNRAFTVILS